ncbi:MAG: signal peptidase [Patescibacteria group bacterium]|nr:signal peptidase [Patescibacteria group bacterium]
MIPEPTDNTEAVKTDSEPFRLQEVTSFFRDLAIILLVVMFVRTYLASPFRISGNSMEENYHDKEFILVDKFSYADFGIARVGDPKRGDVVILRPHAANGKEFYIKRIVGVPGDTLEFKDGEIWLKTKEASEAVKLNETYLSSFNKGRTFLPNDVRNPKFEVPEGEYFSMGDNRNNSSDSRSCFRSCTSGEIGHYLKRSDIVGKVFLDLGYFKIFDSFEIIPFQFQISKNVGWQIKPRLFDTPRTWNYEELNTAK